MNVLQSLPSDLGSKANANDLNVSVPVAAAAAFQISTNFLNSVSNNIRFNIIIFIRHASSLPKKQIYNYDRANMRTMSL